jgi:hypothetical protein
MDRRLRIRRAKAALTGVALLGVVALTGVSSITSAAHADTVSDQAQFVNDINAARIAVGAAPLVVDSRLTTLALYWANQMATANVLSHNPNLAQMGPPGWSILGENVGVGPSEPSLNAAFTASPHHYENMVDTQFSSIGVGEIVADGRLWVAEEFMGTSTAPAPPTASVDGVAAVGLGGYWLTSSDGTVSAHNGATYFGSVSGQSLARPIVGLASLPSGGGYWLVGADGGIFTFGGASYYGSTGAIHLNQPIVGMAPTPTGQGYWLVASDGGIFAFGDARFYGSTGSMHLNRPIVGMTATPTGQGYWLVASDGGIFAFGDARFYGSTGALRLNAPIVSMAPTISGQGYWLAASDGGIFAFGDAGFYGSAGGTALSHPIMSMVATPSGNGYLLVESDGDVHTFGSSI